MTTSHDRPAPIEPRLPCLLSLLTLTWLLCGSVPLRAQTGPPDAPGPAASYLIETAGGTVGSLAGFGLGLAVSRPDECNNEDLACILNGVAVGLATSAVGAGAGAYGAGRWQNTEPSGWGAALGGVLGAAAGLGVVKLMDETSPGSGEGIGAIVAYGVTHGLVTAAFTRIF